MVANFPSSILDNHTACLGKTGSGKTSTAKLLIEQVVAAGARVCVLDPIKSDWWGITSSADGKSPGLPFYILGGPHGHVPLHDTAGKALAEVVANGSLPLSILDMAQFPMGGAQRFFVDFADTLLKKIRGPLYLVLEEAHEFAPKERSGVGAENMAIHLAKRLATAGRSKGLRLIVLTQRTQALHNAMLGSCETLIAHRMTAPADQEPVIKWLKANVPKDKAAEIIGSLSNVKTGVGWICSGEAQLFERRQFPRIATFDNTSGKGDGRAVKTATVDAAKLASIVGEAVAEAKANDPAELQKTIAGLRRQLAAKPAAEVDPAAVERAVAEANRERDRQWAEHVRGVYSAHDDMLARLQRLGPMVTELAHVPYERTPQVTPPILSMNGRAHKPTGFVKPVLQKHPAHARQPLTRLAAAVAEAIEHLPKGERAILTAIAQYPEGVDRSQISILTGYKRSSRDAYVQRLFGRSALEQRGELLFASQHGLDMLGDFAPLPTGDALLRYWLEQLPEGEQRILAEVVADPRGVSREQISDATEYKRSSRDAYIQRLKARKLITTDGGVVRAADILFD